MIIDDHKRELLADLCHEQWSGWMEYLFSKCKVEPDGTMVIPNWAAKRWLRQLSTPYNYLPESEKESDRKEADRFIRIIEDR